MTGFSSQLRLCRNVHELDSQRTANLSELLLIRTRRALLDADVDLMTALGGGWQPAATTTAK